MRALERLRDTLRERMNFVHAARWLALWHVVQALLVGKRLWLTALGRAMPTSARTKHAIKAVDRLLGNRLLYRDRLRIAAAVTATLLRRECRPVVLIDTMEIRHKVVAVTASLAHAGRSFPIWSTTTDALRLRASRCRRFLKQLVQVLPPGCQPIVVTDGGFERAWFDAVERLGWDYIGRVRGQIKFAFGGRAATCQDLHRLATNRAKNLGFVAFPRHSPIKRRLVLSKMPKSRHRRRKTRTGPDRDNNYKHYSKNAHEPLILTTSLTCAPSAVVKLYALRMQIEESFRDLKCYRWGWSLRHCHTRKRPRLEILLLVASIAIVVQQLVGMAGEAAGLQRHYQANTIRERRILSVFLLGALIIARLDQPQVGVLRLDAALAQLRRNIAGLAPCRRG